MKKKMYLILIVSLLAVGISLFLLLTNSKNDEIDDTSTQPHANEETNEEATKEETNENESIGQSVRDAVMEAISFFKKDAHVVAIGDSLTQGVGDEANNGGYIGIIEERLEEENFQVTFDNYGVRGNRTDHLLKRLRENEEITESLQKADFVLITIGANDIMQIMKDNFMNLTEEPFTSGRGPYRDRLIEIFDEIIAVQPDAEIYLLGFFNPFDQYFREIEALNQIVTRWNNESLQVTNQFEQVHYIPMQDIFQYEEENVFADDNFHPNHSGYQLMAERVMEYLENNLQGEQN
ncbi:SGNH/GDSL hydrolase family protein [Gracilibacillus sp. S3-1-1]|uniref:SGNH/GDSL hydrolase family protein n=1 Tax=Gracilibacillus pellucidus TaxID=3095368 RepID=A0ACC6M2H2_9BACI|nr:SGNH/GDSL hydrolase family protein [Gracilibacillus sp. S3-1-1]MDX8045083.1 SGNH/GDSL hydrolase family protein [Gracilibacillus sp. S3-1-1]